MATIETTYHEGTYNAALNEAVTAVVPVIQQSKISLSDNVTSFTADMTEGQQATIQAILNGHATLAVQSSASSVTIGEELIISAGDLVNFAYRVWFDESILLSGSVNDGSLEISFDSEGDYIIEIITGNTTGYAKVRVSNG